MNNHTDFSQLCLGHQRGEKRVSGRVWNPRWEGGWSPLLRAFGVVHRPIYSIAPSSSLPSLPSVDLPIAIIAIRHLLLILSCLPSVPSPPRHHCHQPVLSSAVSRSANSYVLSALILFLPLFYSISIAPSSWLQSLPSVDLPIAISFYILSLLSCTSH